MYGSVVLHCCLIFEDRLLFTSSALHTDLTIFAFGNDGSNLLVDVAVVDPAADSYLRCHSARLAKAAASRLILQLSSHLSEEDGSFSPPNWSANSPSRYWYQRLSVALQRFNAQKMRDLLARPSHSLRYR